jgi:hypothetical protein
VDNKDNNATPLKVFPKRPEMLRSKYLQAERKCIFLPNARMLSQNLKGVALDLFKL